MTYARHYLLPFFLLLLTAASAVYLFVQRTGEVTRHNQTDEIISQLIEAETRIDKDLLHVLSFRLAHFDTLVAATVQLRQLQNTLSDRELGFAAAVGDEAYEQYEKYLALSKMKLSLLEHIKSQTASVKNTLRYLPSAVAAFSTTDRGTGERLSALLNRLQNYNVFPRDELKAEIEREVARLQSMPPGKVTTSEYQNILRHTEANLRFRTATNHALIRYNNIPVIDILSGIRQQHKALFAAKTNRSYYSNIYLFVFAFLLLVALAYTMRNLSNKQLEAEQTRDLLGDAIESINEAFALYDSEDRLLLWNRKFEQYYPAFGALLKPGAAYRELIRHAVEKGQFALGDRSADEYISDKVDNHHGHAREVLESLANNRYYLASDNKTSTGGTASIRVDITQHKRMEEKLRELSVAVEQSPVSIVITDLNGSIEYVNPKFEQVTGYYLEEVRGKNSNILKSGDKDPAEYRNMWEMLGAGRVWHGEFLNRRKNGDEFWETAVITSITDAEGRPIRYLAIKEDITERKQAEERLRMSSTVFNTSSEAIMVTNAENRIKAVNPSFTRITGYTPEEVVGKDPGFLSSGRHDKSFYDEMWMGLHTSGIWQGEIWNRRKNGDIYPEWLSLASIKDDNGNITEYVAVFSDITKRKEAEEKIHWQANFDPLTGLPNRTLFFDRLTRTLVNTQRNEQLCALLFIDLDRFKVVNDSLGHGFGDKLLKEAAQRMKQAVREVDTVSRLGGDEFTVILQNINSEKDAAHIAGVLIKELSRVFCIDDHEVYIGASIGITLYPNDAEDAPTMIRNADMAMYRAKDAGRNTYRFYTQEMNEQMHHRMQIENNMRLALEREELFLEFQPVIDHRTGEVVSAEALVRWDHPSLGCLGPDRFIAIAEESGLIDRVGVWVLRTAAREARRWQDSGLGEIPVSVNISSQQLKLGLSRATLQSVLEETQLPASRLNLEITESLLIDDSSKALTWLEECRQMGLKLYIDDFGTGYSSLSYLKKFPVDVLKIDKSFIRDISTDPDDATLVEAIITLAHSFNLRVIAEGVEDDVQLAFLCDLDCDLIQGFYYSRPLKSADFIHYVRQANHRSLQRKEQQR